MKMKIQHEYLWDAVKKVIREQCIIINVDIIKKKDPKWIL